MADRRHVFLPLTDSDITVCNRTQRLAEVWANLSQRRRTRRRTGKLLINKDGWMVDGCWRQGVSNRRPMQVFATDWQRIMQEGEVYVVASTTRLKIGTAAALLLVQVGAESIYARRVHCMCLLAQFCAACRWRVASVTDLDGRKGRWHHVQDGKTKGKLMWEDTRVEGEWWAPARRGRRVLVPLDF